MKMTKIRISHVNSSSFHRENRANLILKHAGLVGHDHKLPRKIWKRYSNVQKTRKRLLNRIIRRKNSGKRSAESIKNFIKKARFSSDSDDNISDVLKKPVLGQESNEKLLCESPFILQFLEGNANVFGTEEFGMGKVVPVASGVVIRGQFLQFSRGLLVNPGNPYYLPIVDNHGFLLGEFSNLDDLSIREIEV